MLKLTATALFAALAFAPPAHAQAPAEFYRGKQIKFVVGTADRAAHHAAHSG